jgi:hypothetical protein
MFDHVSPRRFWGAIYFTIWALILAMGAGVSLLATTPGQSVAKNLVIVLGIAAAGSRCTRRSSPSRERCSAPTSVIAQRLADATAEANLAEDEAENGCRRWNGRQ